MVNKFLCKSTLILWGLLFIVAPAWTAERALLAEHNEATMSAASAKDAAQANKLARLQKLAVDKGSVRLIVGVRAGFAPEARLAEIEVAGQRQDISRAQTGVLHRLAAVRGQKKKADRFATIPFLALEVNPEELDLLVADSDVVSIAEDGLRATTLAESSPLIGASSAWSADYDGSGQTIAILDTGIDKTHPFLSGKVVTEACYSTNNDNSSSSSLCPGGATASIADGSAVNCDVEMSSSCDHGTHVAGIAAGAGATFSGIARGANLIAIQVFSRFESDYCGGTQPCILSWDSDQLKGLELVYQLRTTYNIAAVNMSLGGGQYFDQETCDRENKATKAVIDNLRAAGIATVIAAGNSAYTDSMGAPGCISSAVSAGSTWDASGLPLGGSVCNEASSTVDTLTCYSNSASFLNLLAPGSAIRSSIPGTGYAVKHGTSMATPHVAGAWAVLKQAVPDISVGSALDLFTITGFPVTDNRTPGNQIVKPRIDLLAALALIAPDATSTLTVNSAGVSNVLITASPTSYAGTTSYSKTDIAKWMTIELTAPVIVDDQTFSSWEGCDAVSAATCKVHMNTSKVVTAHFSPSRPFPWLIFMPALTTASDQ